MYIDETKLFSRIITKPFKRKGLRSEPLGLPHPNLLNGSPTNTLPVLICLNCFSKYLQIFNKQTSQFKLTFCFYE